MAALGGPAGAASERTPDTTVGPTAGPSSRVGRAVRQSAWKFSNPTDPASNAACPKDAKDYEKVVRYNYNAFERSALVEFVTMIKSLTSSLNAAAVD